MNQLELLSKSKHVIEWSDEVPDKALIEKILWNTWKVTRSKNSFMQSDQNDYSSDFINSNNYIQLDHKIGWIEINYNHERIT